MTTTIPNYDSAKIFNDELEAKNFATAVDGWIESSFDDNQQIIYTVFYKNEF